MIDNELCNMREVDKTGLAVVYNDSISSCCTEGWCHVTSIFLSKIKISRSTHSSNRSFVWRVLNRKSRFLVLTKIEKSRQFDLEPDDSNQLNEFGTLFGCQQQRIIFFRNELYWFLRCVLRYNMSLTTQYLNSQE